MKSVICLVTLSFIALSTPLDDVAFYEVSCTQKLPKGSNPTFGMYSGYLDIPNSNGKSLHYVFLESQNSPAKDPLILWLNGGPGCSSMDGLFYEHGPFVFGDNSKDLAENPYAWNKKASIIYLESPAGVGYSVLGDLGNLNTDDDITAHDNLLALLQFFSKYPEYKSHDFYITGESYAGVYVPTLAYNVLLYNESTTRDKINLKGIMVGNAVTDHSVDDVSVYHVGWDHVLYDQTLYNKFNQYCWTSPGDTDKCNDAKSEFDNVIMSGVNIYDLYRDCLPGPTGKSTSDYFQYNSWKTNKSQQSQKLKDSTVPPCVAWEGLYDYLDDPTVRSSFNIPESMPSFVFCSDTLNYTIQSKGSIWAYPSLIKAGLKIWVYSGETDGSVPFHGTRQWVDNLKLPAVQEWQQWYYKNGQQVAGYYGVYEGLTLVTIRGVGHMVPQWAPERAYIMLQAFLFDQPLSG